MCGFVSERLAMVNDRLTVVHEAFAADEGLEERGMRVMERATKAMRKSERRRMWFRCAAWWRMEGPVRDRYAQDQRGAWAAAAGTGAVGGGVYRRGDALSGRGADGGEFALAAGIADGRGLSCVLVLDGEEGEERFGLMVDRVGGVVLLERKMLAENPTTLDEVSRALYSGAYRMADGLLIQLDPWRLNPLRLNETGLFRHGHGRGRGAALGFGSRFDGREGRVRMRALIVDDSRFIREYVRQHLERMGIFCSEAETGGDAALMVLTRDVFDVMLLDVNMPGINGLECVRQVRERGMAPKMKVMMVTTEADNSYIMQALENGADEFLMKPFSPQSLREKLVLLGFETVSYGERV